MAISSPDYRPFDTTGDLPSGLGALAVSGSTDDGIDFSIEQQEDGSVVVDLIEREEEEADPSARSFDENLAEYLSPAVLAQIAEDLLEGIQADEDSRAEWVDQYVKGLDLLGLKIKEAGSDAGSQATLSSVTHPALLEACITFQARARGEVLPANGPVKIRNDGNDGEERKERAQALETDMNHYLTVTATEYYPDTDRGLFLLGFGGTIFKKAYRCPLRNRPVSECVYLPDLIVSNDATDINNAVRITHRIEMSPMQFDRMVAVGAYRDVYLTDPQPSPTPIDQKEAEIRGVQAVPARREDKPHTIYECYTFLDPDLTEEPDADPGTVLPYRVTIDKDSREILEIRRNWREDEPYKPRRWFVKYDMIPGIGFLGLGLLHILGNSTKALTALWRIAIDAGMFSNFPGGVRVKGQRQDTNEIQPAPGEFKEIDLGGLADIRAAIMALPYKDPSATLLQLIDMIQQKVAQLAGTVEIETGDGRTNVPVGTIMSMIEQQTQVMTAVHKRIHAAQQEELILLKELFAEDPEALWRGVRDPKRKWARREEFEDIDLVPASDPNVPAQVHRIQQVMALRGMAQENPEMYNKLEVERRSLRTLNIGDIDTLLVQPQQGEAQDPNAGAQAVAEATLQAETVKAQTAMQTTMAKIQADQQKAMLAAQQKMAEIQSRERIAELNDETKRIDIGVKAGLDLQQIAATNFRTTEEAYGDATAEQPSAPAGNEVP